MLTTGICTYSTTTYKYIYHYIVHVQCKLDKFLPYNKETLPENNLAITQLNTLNHDNYITHTSIDHKH